MRGKRRTTRAAIALSLLVGGCRKVPTGVDLTFERIPELATNGITSISSQSTTVVRDQFAWSDFWTDAFAYVSVGVPPVHVVDFGSSMVLVAAAGARPSGGYRIEITDVRESGSVLDVRVTLTSPSGSCVVTGGETAPLDAVIVPRFDGEVRFETATVLRAC